MLFFSLFICSAKCMMADGMHTYWSDVAKTPTPHTRTTTTANEWTVRNRFVRNSPFYQLIVFLLQIIVGYKLFHTTFPFSFVVQQSSAGSIRFALLAENTWTRSAYDVDLDTNFKLNAITKIIILLVIFNYVFGCSRMVRTKCLIHSQQFHHTWISDDRIR